jgi:glycosyltransferase A (GT-A) superfamily protein (DUF2064 family)
MNHQTAILIFTRTAQEEAQQKWKASDRSTSNNRRVAQTLIAHTRRVARATGYAVVEISSRQQRGRSFGQRISHAVEQIWQQGFAQVLVVGTDTPLLNTTLLHHAAQQISSTQSVLGAATDGGAYLLGLHRQQFQKEAFTNLPWQSPTLYQALSAQFSTNSQHLHHLPPLSDLDTWEDLLRFVQTAPFSVLRLWLHYYTHVLKYSSVSLTLPTAWKKNFTTPRYNRPPPIGH